tara:strand:- start:2902 stop:4047 length:1146 start_codon:yes stop_codon:yes gene_type:complete
MLNTGFSPWPSYTEEEAQAVQEILLSNKVNYWTGDNGRMFEKEFSEFVGCNYSVAVANGTLALDLSLKALGISDQDEVIVTARTYLASVTSIVNSGARPIFADIDLDSQNITAETIEKLITTKTKAIMCVHLAGWPCEMDDIIDLAKTFNLFVIEDCSQAHGARYKGKSVGSLGDIGCWSFCQDKIITTGGEGGMVTTNSKELWSKMWSYKDHGKDWDTVYKKKHKLGFKWVHETFGTNWRITEMQSVIGRIQLKRMHKWHENRIKYANQIWSVAASCASLRVPKLPDHIEHAAYKCYVFSGKQERQKLLNDFISNGIPCSEGACPEVYLEKAFENSGLRPTNRLPNSKLLGETSLSFLCHPTLTQEEVNLTCDKIKSLCD